MPLNEVGRLVEASAERGAKRTRPMSAWMAKAQPLTSAMLCRLLEAFNTAKHTAWQILFGDHRLHPSLGRKRADQAETLCWRVL